MYSSSYSQTKLGPSSSQPLYRNKGKSCGYYMRIIFFFSSLIQSLIIISLVLFLIYGQPEKSAEEKRVEELEQGFNKLSKNNIDLRKEKAELGAQLAARTAEKAALEKEMAKQQTEANNTEHRLNAKIAGLSKSLNMQRPSPPFQLPPSSAFMFNSEANNLRNTISQKDKLIKVINTNFTQTVQYLREERDNALRDQQVQLKETLKLRTDKTLLSSQLKKYTSKCKEDFAKPLLGIQIVTTMFLDKINNLFPHSPTFHLTCNSQREQLENIKNSCTNLSREVESKFQLYLNNVGSKMSEIEFLSSRLEVENSYLNSTLRQCEDEYRRAVTKAASDLALSQKFNDDKFEKTLIEQIRMREQQKLLQERLALKDKEIQELQKLMPSKAGLPMAVSPQTVLLQGRHTASGGTTGISKPSVTG
ncbi:plasmalemma vesicle associated protein b [Anableps anableps]